jgi:CHAT domain-containing protein
MLDIRLYHQLDFKTQEFGPARLAGVLIPPAGDIVVRDLGSAEEIDANVSRLLSGSSEAAEKAAAAIYQQVLAPFTGDLADLKRLYLAPDGALNLVSFGLLRDPDGQRVMDRFDLRLVQTGRDLLRPAADKPATGLIAIGGIDFDLALPNAKPDAAPATQTAQADVIVDRIKRTRGDTLDSLRNGFGALARSKEEVETIADLYGDARRDETVKVAEGATPTKAWMLGLPPPRVLHLATHGFYRAPKQPSDQPMLLAGIALAGANHTLKEGGDGGILYALEAQDLNLEGTELVVLSACQTALGQYDYGDGVSGLVRALRVAGARNVLVTLRSVDDEQAAKFMQRFYFHWLSQKQSDPAAALRDAQAEYANAPNQDTTWTSFIIVGE